MQRGQTCKLACLRTPESKQMLAGRRGLLVAGNWLLVTDDPYGLTSCRWRLWTGDWRLMTGNWRMGMTND